MIKILINLLLADYLFYENWALFLKILHKKCNFQAYSIYKDKFMKKISIFFLLCYQYCKYFFITKHIEQQLKKIRTF